MNVSPPNNEKELFARIANGDEAAFAELFHLYTPKIFPFALKMVRDENEAREVVQETFIRVWMKREELNKIENPSWWIFRIVSNVSITYLRSLGRKRRVLAEIQSSSTAAAPDEELEMDARHLNSYIQQAVAALPERRQLIYRMVREQGLSYQQIADELGISINTVKDQMSKALHTIQQQIVQYTGLSIITVIVITNFQ